MKSEATMDWPQLIKKLSEPFPVSAIRWRVGRTNKDEGMAQALPLGILGATRGVAMLIFGLYGGALADRLDRRRLLMATSAFALVVNAMISVMALSKAVREE
jgi:MFS family permease